MSDLPEFLLARIAETANKAEAAQRRVARWTEAAPPWENAKAIAHLGPLEAFAALHNPARVLAECAAERRIVELHGELHWYSGARGNEPTGKCRMCAENEESDYEGAPLVAWPCPTLRALASVYADHPDYRQEWKP